MPFRDLNAVLDDAELIYDAQISTLGSDISTNSYDLAIDGNNPGSVAVLFGIRSSNSSDSIKWTLQESSDDSSFSDVSRDGSTVQSDALDDDPGYDVLIVEDAVGLERYIRLQMDASDSGQNLASSDVEATIWIVPGYGKTDTELT